MSGIRFRKEDVAISVFGLKGAAGSAVRAVTRPHESEILRLDACRVTAQFDKLSCAVKPPLIP